MSGRPTKDLTNHRFGRLLVLARVKTKERNPIWKVQCDCGKFKRVRGYCLVSGNTTSCGCFAKEQSSDRIHKARAVVTARVLSRDRQGRKLCTMCNRHRPEIDYQLDTRASDGLRNYCRVCCSAMSTRYQYRLEPAQDAALGNTCGVCAKEVVGADRQRDHDHACCPGTVSCGKCIRGVLCAAHNKAEGLIGGLDNALALVDYLLNWEERRINV